MSTNPEDAEYELAMPFLATKDNGGPLDSHAYVCGVEMGDLMNRIAYEGAGPLDLVVHSENVTTIDLLAMRHGFQLWVGDWDETETTPEQRAEWTLIRLARPNPEEDPT